jgi:ATP-dependent Clp protease adaptor protein ClpS
METQKQSEIAEKESITESSKLILWNDDVNTFDHVIDCLVSICDHTSTQAEQCAYIVHYNGKCVVKEGGKQKLKPLLVALQLQQLSAEIK